ncbi:hypothetical protein, partial [Alistipes sp. An66]|uniref:hypothetical protein n=1 Tax=Alistipes sp. An66 TaxID=1965650 RepID=UPI00194F1C25
SNSIGQVLFQRADIREIYNQPTTPVSVPEAGSVEQPTLWSNFSGQQCHNSSIKKFGRQNFFRGK